MPREIEPEQRIPLRVTSRADAWRSVNGQYLVPARGERWVAVHVYPGREYRLAQLCAAGTIPFFLPLLLRPDDRTLVPLWTGYIICRLNQNDQRYLLERKNFVVRILDPRDQLGFLEQLKRVGTVNTLQPQFNPGDLVRVVTGNAAGLNCTGRRGIRRPVQTGYFGGDFRKASKVLSQP